MVMICIDKIIQLSTCTFQMFNLIKEPSVSKPDIMLNIIHTIICIHSNRIQFYTHKTRNDIKYICAHIFFSKR